MEMKLKDIGPIKSLTIRLPESGIVVLRGPNGSGKSTAIRAANRALGGSSKDLTARDGTKAGELAIGDVTLRITRSRTTTIGDVEFDEIESKLDISSLVDPGIHDRDRADAARIKALVGLSGVVVTESDFYPAVVDKSTYDSLCVEWSDDPLVVVGRIKRACEAAARRHATKAESLRLRAIGVREVTPDVDVDDLPPTDEQTLRAAYDLAAANLLRIEEQCKASDLAANHRVDSQAKIDEARASLSVVNIDSLFAASRDAVTSASNEEKAIELMLAEIDEMRRKAQVIKDDIAIRKTVVVGLRTKSDSLLASAKAAEQQRLTIEDWERSLAIAAPIRPTADAMAAANDAAAAAYRAMQVGAETRDAVEHIVAARGLMSASISEAKDAEVCRRRAAAVEQTLTDMIPMGPLRVEDGRLVTTTDRGDRELFSDLSDGERWRIAIDLACDRLQAGGMLTIPQHGWEGIDPATRSQIDAHATERGVVILTAEATDGELVAAAFGEG